MTDCTTTISVWHSTAQIAPTNTVDQKWAAVKQAKSAYYTACEERDAAWKNYSNAVDDCQDGKISRNTLDAIYTASTLKNKTAKDLYTAYHNQTAEYLAMLDCNCVADQSCDICRATARRVYNTEVY